jgi:hypothetical protein
MKIAMKCSQEQWDSIKDKLVGCELVGVSNFVTYDYLINYRFGNKNHITNYTWLAVRGDDAEIHAEWNEQTFLKACGIETEIIFKGSELQFRRIGQKWTDFSLDVEFRIKPDYSREIAELERKIQELKNK